VSEKKVRIGIIGTSWWVDLMYVPSLGSHPSAEVVAVCGRNEMRAREIAAKFGASLTFQDYRQLIAGGTCDAVVIAAPDDLHCEMVLAALDAGLHVLCEKPLAGNAADAALMHARAVAAGVKHMVLYTWRWQPHWRYVKHLIDGGYLGRCLHAEFRFLGGFALEPYYKWRFDGRRANGVIGDLGSHMIDFAQWYLGEIAAVSADLHTFTDQAATASPPPLPANDAACLSLSFTSGTHATILASAVSLLGDEGVRVTASLFGDEGSLEIQHPYFGIRSGAVIRGIRKGEPAFAELPVPASFLAGKADPGQLFDPYVKQSAGPRLFVDAILHDTAIEPDFEVGVRVQEVVDAALLSSREGRSIRLKV
jgi:predicted dehydrogenase